MVSGFTRPDASARKAAVTSATVGSFDFGSGFACGSSAISRCHAWTASARFSSPRTPRATCLPPTLTYQPPLLARNHGLLGLAMCKAPADASAEWCPERCPDTYRASGNAVEMGLGLSFTVVVLEHHRAGLAIESEPLKGATFRLTFPLAGYASAAEK